MIADLRRCFDRIVLASSILVSVAACSDSGSPGGQPDGGQAGSTGLAGAGGSSPVIGGHTGSAGAAGGSTGAAESTAAAGTSGSGGQLGGATAIGGTSAVAGATATGGKATTGGTKTGGATTGGTTTTGGAKTGGTTATGGSTGSGGKTSTGGITGTGGTSATGGASGGSTGTGGTTGNTGEYGFSYRPADGWQQLDWLCTLKAVGASTYVYIRLDKTGEKSMGMTTIPLYTAVLAKISDNGAVTDLANMKYDYGGGHHIDTLQFDYQGSYTYRHSSIGVGYRPCQLFDCVDSPTAGGCSGRSLPEVCVNIKADGTHDPLVDNFEPCPSH